MLHTNCKANELSTINFVKTKLNLNKRTAHHIFTNHHMLNVTLGWAFETERPSSTRSYRLPQGVLSYCRRPRATLGFQAFPGICWLPWWSKVCLRDPKANQGTRGLPGQRSDGNGEGKLLSPDPPLLVIFSVRADIYSLVTWQSGRFIFS